MRFALALILPATLAGCPRPAPPTGATEPPRLPAVDSCEGGVELAAAPLPVPARPPADPYHLSPWAQMVVRADGGVHGATLLCDLPDQILALAADQTVAGGKRVVSGTAYTIPRVATAPRIPPVAILPSSPGCLQGQIGCTFTTSSPAMTSIETLQHQWVSTSGWVHGPEEMCRALPDDTIATCSTLHRLAYVELGCQRADTAPVALQLGLHDATLERRFDLDIEVPVARLDGRATTADGTRFVYAFTGSPTARAPGPKAATLTFDLTDAAAPVATLELDGVREPCVAFGIYRR